MNKPNKPIGIDDVRDLLVGGDGHCDTYGVGLAMALDAMTSASRDLLVAASALKSPLVDEDEVMAVVHRVAWQLKSMAGICWRVAGAEGIVFDDTERAYGAAEPEEGEAAE